MKKLILILPFLICASLLRAQTDSLVFTDEYLDTVVLRKAESINDYHMIGVNYGVTFSTVYFNPDKMGTDFRFNPTYFSIMYTHYEKMFNYLPYFGITLGFSYSHEGCTFRDNPETGYPMGYIDGATDVSITTMEMPAMMHFHVDAAPTKIMANLGGYVGYRTQIERSGIYMDAEYANKFRDYEYRFDYGIIGGAGIAFMIDPIELHFNILARWSMQSLYEPDYFNETFHPYNTYYYRYANPIDISVTAGIYFQLTKRTGKTSKQLKKQARDIVYGTTDNTASQDR
ncbi:MAG: PorT family protein [Bacteroidales bacterium]|nr:PorT family protein [Bacteroidales bacterium]